LLFEVELLFFKSVLERLDLAEGASVFHRDRDLFGDLAEQLRALGVEGVFAQAGDAQYAERSVVRDEWNETTGFHSGGGEALGYRRFHRAGFIHYDGLARRKRPSGRTPVEGDDLALDEEVFLRGKFQRRDSQLVDRVIVEGQTRGVVRHDLAQTDG